MPPFNLLLLPLLGGFAFVSKWYPTRYYTLRSDGYRLIFTAAIAGATFLLVASIITHFTPYIFFGPEAYRWWHQVAKPDDSGKAALAMLLGVTLWLPLNLLGRWVKFFGDDAAINRTIARKHDPLELFLSRALRAKRLISVSVENGKIYIGYLTSNYNPAFPLESISLIPSFSGHRDNETKLMSLDLNYTEVYKAIQSDLQNKLATALQEELIKNPRATEAEVFAAASRRVSLNTGQNYEIILPIREVQSVNVFDVDAYIKHFTTAAFTIPAQTQSAQTQPAQK